MSDRMKDKARKDFYNGDQSSRPSSGWVWESTETVRKKDDDRARYDAEYAKVKYEEKRK